MEVPAKTERLRFDLGPRQGESQPYLCSDIDQRHAVVRIRQLEEGPELIRYFVEQAQGGLRRSVQIRIVAIGINNTP